MTREERVIGTYLAPPRLFSDDSFRAFTKEEATEVIRQLPIGTTGPEHVVHVTRVGGLFVRPPEHLSLKPGEEGNDEKAKIEFETQVAASLNVLLSELALRGAWSEPVSPLHLAAALLSDGHIHRMSLVFHAETEGWERTHGPTTLIERYPGWWFHWSARRRPEGVLDEVAKLAAASRLFDLSPTLPVFVVSAFASLVRRQAASSIINSWLVIEQILSSLWEINVVAKAVNSEHRQALNSVDFTASVRHNVLTVLGSIDTSLYNQLVRARKHRNDVMHYGKADLARAEASMTAMCDLLEWLCKVSVERPDLTAHDSTLAW